MDKKKDLTRFEKQSKERIAYLIDRYCSGSQQRFADMTDINKASVSQYVNGKNTPSNVTAGKIAFAFNVNPAWVMGFDVPMKKESTIVSPEEAQYYLDPEVAEMAQKLHDDENIRIIFDATRKATKEDLQFIVDMLKRMGLNE